MKLSEIDYALPEGLIALHPQSQRDHCRLLVVDRSRDTFEHRKFFNIVDCLNPNDLLVLNDTKVIPARLKGTVKGKPFEVFLLSQISETSWTCLVKPGKYISDKVDVLLKDNTVCEVERSVDDFRVSFPENKKHSFFDWLSIVGELPLPPYIPRAIETLDYEDYQTQYARHPGSVAAPTAGLHFTTELLQKISEKGIRIAYVTLHVGYGTFAPIRSDHVEDHQMHGESYVAPPELNEQIAATRESRGKVVAVGTTVVRTLESLPELGPSGNTRLFIKPGHRFKNVDAMITNFHLPKSTLLVMIQAMMGPDMQRRAYASAIEQKYRFFSYGDAMLIL